MISSEAPPGGRAPAQRPAPWRAFAALALVQVMLVLDDTVVNVALPSVQGDLGFSSSTLSWVVNGYILPYAGLLLLGGRIADLAGRRKLFLIGVGVFGLASLASGLAQSDGTLVASRVLQGVGAALVAPAALALVLSMFEDPASRAKAVGVWAGLAAIGATLGMVVGGALVEVASWRWVFFINLPVAAVALILVPRIVPESRASQAGRLDVAGGATLTGGLVLVVYGIVQAGEHGWGSTSSTVALLVAAALLGAFVLSKRGSANRSSPCRSSPSGVAPSQRSACCWRPCRSSARCTSSRSICNRSSDTRHCRRAPRTCPPAQAWWPGSPSLRSCCRGSASARW